jgi:hypothetical protein
MLVGKKVDAGVGEGVAKRIVGMRDRFLFLDGKN